MSTALVMFGFMRWLTKNIWVAIFSAYAVTFTPYHLFASWGQLAGLLGAVFILALWQFIDLWRVPKLSKALRLGAVVGVGFYIDGYFILFGGVMMLAFWLASLGYGFLARGGLRLISSRLWLLFWTTIITLMFLLPLLWVKHNYAAQVDSFLGTVRGDIAVDAQLYSAQPMMYINPSSILFIGFIVFLLSIVAIFFLWRDRRILRKSSVPEVGWSFSAWVSATLAFVAIWFSLRPKGSLLGMTIYNPSSLVIALTSTWRVFGRLYMLVVVALVVLAGLGLARLIASYPSRRYWILGISFALLVAELWLFAPTPPAQTSFDYRQAPPVYTWLKDNPAIRAVAEYPLDEPPQGNFLADYYTFQQISGKPLLNTMLPNSPQAGLRRSVAGITDPQTLPVLRALGVDIVNIRPVHVGDVVFDPPSIPGLTQKFEYSDDWRKIRSYVIEDGLVADYALTIPALQYFQVTLAPDGTATYAIGDETSLELVKMPNTADRDKIPISFSIASDRERQATIVQNGSLLWSGVLSTGAQTIRFEASPGSPILIHNQTFKEQLTRLTITGMQAF